VAKKKVNVRKEYDLGKRDGISYGRSSIQRKPFFLILRGPSLEARQVIEENKQINEFCDDHSIKVKYLSFKTEAEAILHLKDANTWASGVVIHLGAFPDEQGKVAKTMKSILIPVISVSSSLDADVPIRSSQIYLDGIQKMRGKS
jgi:hypothetical protein